MSGDDAEALLVAVVDELLRVHGVHTVILYGSRARGDDNAQSDLDVASFADVPRTLRDARVWRGIFLDGFVYPTAVTESSDPDLLKLCGARVLLDERGLAGALIERMNAIDRAGPVALPEDEQRMRRVWAHKMLARIERDDIEARYRRHWLLYSLLEDHFALKGRWYRGPKLALAELERGDTETFAAFERALDPAASSDAVVALVDRVIGPL